MKSSKSPLERRVILRDSISGRFASKVSVPGIGEVHVLRREGFTSAKDAAGSRLRTVISTSGDQKRDR